MLIDDKELDDIDIGYKIKYTYIDGKMYMYRLFYWRRRYIFVRVSHNCDINVYARKKDSDQDIENAIQDKKFSIKFWNEHKESILINYQNNQITILTKKYILKPISRKLRNKFEIFGNTVYINAKDNAEKKDVCKKIFEAVAGDYFRKTTMAWAQKMGIRNKVKKIEFNWSRSYLGQCWAGGKIQYSYRAFPFEKKAIEALIVHELCHLFHMNHKKEFWNEVYKWLPEYKEYFKIFNHDFFQGTVENIED